MGDIGTERRLAFEFRVDHDIAAVVDPAAVDPDFEMQQAGNSPAQAGKAALQLRPAPPHRTNKYVDRKHQSAKVRTFIDLIAGCISLGWGTSASGPAA